MRELHVYGGALQIHARDTHLFQHQVQGGGGVKEEGGEELTSRVMAPNSTSFFPLLFSLFFSSQRFSFFPVI